MNTMILQPKFSFGHDP